MRTRGIAAGGICFVVVAGWMTTVVAQNALAGLGVQESDAKRDMVYALSNGRVDIYPARQAFKAAAPASRAALVKTAMAWARTYTESAAFKAQYDRERARAAPAPPKPKNVDQELARQKAERQKSLDEAKKNLEQMPANVRSQMQATLEQMESDNAKREADPQFAAMMRQALEMEIAADQQRYRESVAQHEQRFPADPNQLIATRLREFLKESEGVDFSATLVTAGGRQRFQNAAYEAKPAEWKLCYRAGKDAVGAARQFAQAWLASIGGK